MHLPPVAQFHIPIYKYIVFRKFITTYQLITEKISSPPFVKHLDLNYSPID